jgi:transketolase
MTTTQLGYDALPTLMTRMTGDEKHSASATSTLDVLWVLYDEVLRVTPGTVTDPGRDRFLLSKGHGPMAYYAVLTAKGFLDPDQLDRFGAFDSPLGYHPDATLLPGVEIASGSLGHGLPIAIGLALGLRGLEPTRPHVVVLVGDAELDEGSNAEAIALAGRFGLSHLTCVVIDNASSTWGWPGGIARRFAVEGWATRDVDGRDHAAIAAALHPTDGTRPRVVVAHVDVKE